MAYTPLTWENGRAGGTKINRDRLQHMDDGITAANSRLDAIDGVSDIGDLGDSISLTAGGGNGTAKIGILTENCMITFNVGGGSGLVKTLELVLTQDEVGGWVPLWQSTILWREGRAPVLSTAPGATDRLVFVSYDDGESWFGDLIGKAYA